jgi:hypothetical protein
VAEKCRRSESLAPIKGSPDSFHFELTSYRETVCWRVAERVPPLRKRSIFTSIRRLPPRQNLPLRRSTTCHTREDDSDSAIAVRLHDAPPKSFGVRGPSLLLRKMKARFQQSCKAPCRHESQVNYFSTDLILHRLTV